ncbi:MAG: hypothetical protein ACYDAN_17380, partial [Candidatus Limnocylindrales bacterium]
MRMADVDEIGKQLGRGSLGVVSARELRDAKADMSVVARLVANGSWTRLWRGMYLTAAHPAGPLVRASAALKHAELRHVDAGRAPSAVVTGLAGARALEMRWVPASERIQVLVGAGVHRESTEHVLVRRAADLEQVETWSWGGVRVANPARLVVDGARECSSLRDVRGLVLGAVADSHADPEELTRLLDNGAVGRTAWTRRAVRDAERGAASPPEAELVDDLIGCGLPFYVNATLCLQGRFIGIADVYLLGTGVGGEMDSKQVHGDADRLDDTLVRHDTFTGAELSLVHVTPGRYRANPTAFHDRLFAAVVDRQRRGLGEPEGLVVTPRGPL